MAEKEKDVHQIVRYLTSTLNQAMTGHDRPYRDDRKGANASYIIQTEFAYLLNEVMMCPRCMLQKSISDCNEFIDQVIQMSS
jgi:hypothetical protein